MKKILFALCAVLSMHITIAQETPVDTVAVVAKNVEMIQKAENKAIKEREKEQKAQEKSIKDAEKELKKRLKKN
jgi:hypothetical protein